VQNDSNKLLSARIEKRIFLDTGRSLWMNQHHRQRRVAVPAIDGAGLVIIAAGVSWVNYTGA
jgi:hypothetical protein